MKVRYNLERSDNIPYKRKKAYTCSGNGFITIDCGFPVTSAAITWSSLPNYETPYEMSSTSSSTSSSSSKDSSSSSSMSESSFIYEEKYCINGCSIADVNGEYSKTGSYWHNKPIWSNGIRYMYWQLFSGQYYWNIGAGITDETVDDAYQEPTLSTPEGIWVEVVAYPASFNVYSGECSSSSSSSSIDSSSSSSSIMSSESSESYGNLSTSSSSYHPNYIVDWATVDGTPDATGVYYENGTFGGYPAYSREDGAYWLFYDATGFNEWSINTTKSLPALWMYTSPFLSQPPLGVYPTFVGATQDVRVTLYPEEYSSSSTSSSSSSTSSSSESSLTSYEYPGPFSVPRIYIYDYAANGFRVRYENIPEEIGFVEFEYVAV